MNTHCFDQMLMPCKLIEYCDDDEHCVELHSCAGTIQHCDDTIKHCDCTTEYFSVTMQYTRYNGAS